MTEPFFAPPKEDSPPGDLPKWLTDLRDGTIDAQVGAGRARQARIAQLEHDIIAAGEFVADCDRYAEFMSTLDNPCEHALVPKLMGRNLLHLRRRAVTRAAALREELAMIRRSA